LAAGSADRLRVSQAASGLTRAEIEDQYGKIRSAAIQSWLTMLVVCGVGVLFVGWPAVFGAIAAVHTGGLPFVLGYARRWRDGLLKDGRPYCVSCMSFSRKRR
jgi:hypothetical protein